MVAVPVLPLDGTLHSLLPQQAASARGAADNNSNGGSGGGSSTSQQQQQQQQQLVAWRWPWHSPFFRTLSAPTGSTPQLWWWAIFIGVTAWMAAVVLKKQGEGGVSLLSGPSVGG